MSLIFLFLAFVCHVTVFSTDVTLLLEFIIPLRRISFTVLSLFATFSTLNDVGLRLYGLVASLLRLLIVLFNSQSNSQIFKTHLFLLVFQITPEVLS